MSAPTPEFLRRTDGSSEIAARIETPRLVIRSIVEDDFSHVFKLQSDPAVMAFVGAGGVRDEGRVRRMFDFYRRYWMEGNPISAYTIFEKTEGGDEKFCGMAALEEISDYSTGTKVVEPGRAEVMIYFMPEFWRKGMASEVAQGFIALLGKLHKSGVPLQVAGEPVTKLIASASPGNAASIALQERLGFRFVEERDQFYNGGATKVPKKLFEMDLIEKFKELAATTGHVSAASAGAVVGAEKSSPSL